MHDLPDQLDSAALQAEVDRLKALALGPGSDATGRGYGIWCHALMPCAMLKSRHMHAVFSSFSNSASGAALFESQVGSSRC